ncbi:MAG: hypothetical protein LDL26_01810 [Caenispirillum bisanense]|nr:hypothetical protein [Caenispirillum bisanense]MCA1971709.1 hypothetical protein [Caenispirillum sp.]
MTIFNKGAAAVCAAAVMLAVVPAVHAAEAPPLPSFTVDWSQVSVSGLSSGAFMAVQVQTAHSADIMGAGIFAGGPYGCARGNLTLATLSEAITSCVNIEQVSWTPVSGKGSYLRPPVVKDLVAGTRDLARSGAIDPVSGLADDKVYLFSGKADHTVPQAVMTALKQWYGAFVPAAQVTGDFGTDAGHAMITGDYKNDCPVTELPYINDCNLDGAGKTLATIYGPLKSDPAAKGRIIAFDQRAFVPEDSVGYDGLHDLGHLFVPEQCETGATACKLHVVFHGCQQNQDFIGDDYWLRTGYNEHAAANDIIVLYPQTKASEKSAFNPLGMPNPKGCWDWWGFTTQDYLTKNGVQMRAVWGMVERVANRSNR